jgi:hypothetical protein
LGLAVCYQEYIQILKIHAPFGWGRRLDEFFVVLVRLKSVAIFGPVAILGPKTVVAYFGRFRACFVAHVQLQPAFQFLAVGRTGQTHRPIQAVRSSATPSPIGRAASFWCIK